MTDKEIIAELKLDSDVLSSSSIDGNILFRERLDEVCDEILLCRGICNIGTSCEDEEIYNSFLD